VDADIRKADENQEGKDEVKKGSRGSIQTPWGKKFPPPRTQNIPAKRDSKFRKIWKAREKKK